MTAFFTKSIQQAADVIKQGGVIVCPSEGVYGISCSLFNEDAIKRVIKIKERDVSKGLIIVDYNQDKISSFIDKNKINEKSSNLMNKMWPGAHTFVLPCKLDFKSTALRENHSCAIRITAFDTLANLCKLSGTPLISTSANISGFDATSAIEKLDDRVIQRVDCVLALDCGGQCAPTSIYDTINEKLVRKGPNWIEND